MSVQNLYMTLNCFSQSNKIVIFISQVLAGATQPSIESCLYYNFSMKICGGYTFLESPAKAIPINTHDICFYGEIGKIKKHMSFCFSGKVMKLTEGLMMKSLKKFPLLKVLQELRQKWRPKRRKRKKKSKIL